MPQRSTKIIIKTTDQNYAFFIMCVVFFNVSYVEYLADPQKTFKQKQNG